MLTSFIRWNVNPEIVEIFGIPIGYYGLFFMGGLFLCIYLFHGIYRKENIPVAYISKLSLYVMVGIFVGARLGHCLFYEPSYYLTHPFEMIFPIQSSPDGGYEFVGYHGLASHGAIIGLVVAIYLYSKKTKQSFVKILDLIVLVASLEGSFIRLGNLMNSEILGTSTNVSWAFVFERVDNVPRHPAQLYEAISYLLIFGVIWYLYKTKREKLQNGSLFGLTVALVFTFRFFIEFIKERQVSFENRMQLDMGQWLSIPFVIIGIGLLLYGLKKTNEVAVIPAKRTEKIKPKK